MLPLYFGLLLFWMLSQVTLLQFVMLRCCPDVVMMSGALQLAMIPGEDGVSLGTQKVTFGMLDAPTLAFLGTIERSWDVVEHKKGDVGIQAWISVDFRRISGPQVESVWSTLGQNLWFLTCMFTGHVFK